MQYPTLSTRPEIGGRSYVIRSDGPVRLAGADAVPTTALGLTD
jgi:hypothetical protein